MGKRRTSESGIDDDVRSSLDLLDGVIGEFDDGLQSGVESDVQVQRRHHQSSNEDLVRDDRNIQLDVRKSRTDISDRIDDIFSELNEEIYNEDKEPDKPKQRSPTRNRFDPLPIPPVNAKTHPPPIDRKKKPSSDGNHGMERSKTQNTLTSGRSRRAHDQEQRNSSLPPTHNRSINEDVDDRANAPHMPEKQKIHLKYGSSAERKVNNSKDRRRKDQEHKNDNRERSTKNSSPSNERRSTLRDKRAKSKTIQDEDKRQRSYNRNDDTKENVPRKQTKRQDSNRKGTTNDERQDRERSGRRVRRPSGDSNSSGDNHPRQSQSNEKSRRDNRRSQSSGPLEYNSRDRPDQYRERSRSKYTDREKSQDAQSRGSRYHSPYLDDKEGRTRSKSRGRKDTSHSDLRSGPQNKKYLHPTNEELRQRSTSQGRSPTTRNRPESRPSRGVKDLQRESRDPPSPEEAQAIIDRLLPRYPHGIPPERQRSMIDLRVSDEIVKNQRRSLAYGPLDNLPPHLRSVMIPGNKNSSSQQNIPSHIDGHLRYQHQMNIEAQRDLLRKRGVPTLPSSGKVFHHQAVKNHLDIQHPTTLPMGQEDARRFQEEMYRKKSHQELSGVGRMVSTIPMESHIDKNKNIKRNGSQRDPSFALLPKKESHQKVERHPEGYRTKETDSQEKKQNKPFSKLSGGGWFNKGNARKDGLTDNTQAIDTSKHIHHEQQWFMKERDNLKSMPPIVTSTPRIEESNKLTRNDKMRSSFGMILKDKFQKNPNMYFPDTSLPQQGGIKQNFKDTKEFYGKVNGDSLSETDTLLHNMSEGSFDKSSSISGDQSIVSQTSNRSGSDNSLVSHDSMNGTPRMVRRNQSITTPKKPPETARLVSTNSSVILNKKTIRNYTPSESNNMLRKYEGTRQQNTPEKDYKQNMERANNNNNDSSKDPSSALKSPMDKLIDDFHRNLPPVNTRNNEAVVSVTPFSDGDSMFSGSHLDQNTFDDKPKGGVKTFKVGTVTSQTSNWSAGCSVASFDYHSVNSMNNNNNKPNKNKFKMNSDVDKKSFEHDQISKLPSLSEVENHPPGVRIPPEGASSNSPLPTNKHLNEIPERMEINDDDPNNENNDDELSMLKKLISEGRIPGLNEKPPPFIPPTPPISKSSLNKKAKQETPSKPTDTKQEGRQYIPQSSRSGDRPRKNREAPKPPPQQLKTATSTSDLRNEKEDTGQSRRSRQKESRKEGVQRSTSMHVPRDVTGEDAALAQLIADSTEKKFKINDLFKGMWKKKYYSFDLG